MFRRIDPRESIAAQFRDLVQRKLECPDQDSAEVCTLMFRIDCILDRWLALAGRESNSGPRSSTPVKDRSA